MNFDTDIRQVLDKFPLLKLQHGTNNSYRAKISGELEIASEGTYIDTFDIEIYFPTEYPNCFPKVIETGGKIPRSLDRHVFTKTNHLCLAHQIDELLLCKNRINGVWFIENILIPRLCDEYNVNHGGKYQKEYPHGPEAVWLYLQDKLCIDDPTIIQHVIEMAVKKKLPRGDRPCICGSQETYNKCHKKKVSQLLHLGLAVLGKVLEDLSNDSFKPNTQIDKS